MYVYVCLRVINLRDISAPHKERRGDQLIYRRYIESSPQEPGGQLVRFGTESGFGGGQMEEI